MNQTTRWNARILLLGAPILLTGCLPNNAILHTPGNTQIKVSLRSSGTQTEFMVADNGSGIAEAYRLRVFSTFLPA